MSILVYLSYSCVLLLTFLWGYTFIYNKNILQRYSNFLHVPRYQINQYLDSILHKKYGLNVIQVNIEENSEDDTNSTPSVPKEGNNSVKNNIIGILFSSTLSLTIGLVILMMCELIDYFDVEVRLTLFKLTIDSLMFLLIFMLPFCIISLFMVQDLIPFRKSKRKSVVTVILFAVWFVILHKCGDLTHKFSPRSNNIDTTRNLIERKVNEISIVGITILAILSGIGCTSTPYRVFNIERLINRRVNQDFVESNKKKQLGESDINTAIQYFNNTTSLLTKRKMELNKLTISEGTIYNIPNDINSTDGILPPKRKDLTAFIHRVQSFTTLPKSKYNNSEESELTKEIESLKNLRNNLYDDIIKISSKFIRQQQQTSNGATIFTKLLYLGNILFGIYCIYRIVNVFVIKLPMFYIYGGYNEEDIEEGGTKDALAITLAGLTLTIFKNLSISKPHLINQLSFIISGALFLCSFNNVLITFKSFSKFFTSSSTDITKNWLKHLIIGELIGIYVIATALLIRTNLPANLSNQISKILSLSGTGSNNNKRNSNAEVLFIDNWFDKIFALACIVTTIVLIIKKIIEEDELDPYMNEEYDEESFVEHTEYKLA